MLKLPHARQHLRAEQLDRVQGPLAELILSGKIKDGEAVAISANRQGVTFNGEVAAAA